MSRTHWIRSPGDRRAVQGQAALYLLASAALWFSHARPAAAQPALDAVEQAVPQSPGALDFRRVFAPADRVADWPRGNLRYVPIEPEEFERLVGLQSQPDGAQPQVWLQAAEYETVVAADGLCTVEALWVVETHAPQTALLPLTDLRCVPEQLAWQAAAGAPRTDPAVIGLDPQQRLALVVERSGSLRGRFQFVALGNAASGYRTTWPLPLAAQTTLQVRLPEGWTAAAEPAVLAGAAPPAEGVAWTFHAAVDGPLQVQFRPRDATTELPAEVRTSTHAQLSLRGLDLSSNWTIRNPGAAPSELRVAQEPGLTLVAARCNGQDLSWRVQETAPDGSSLLALDLPAGSAAEQTSVQLLAVASLLTDRPWQLPALRPAGLAWTEGAQTLTVESPLELHDLEPRDCHQVGVEALAAPESGRRWQFQDSSPAAALRVQVGLQAAELEVQPLTHVLVLESGLAAACRIRCTLLAGQRSVLLAELPENWVVESAETLPAGGLADWYCDLGEKNTLTLALAAPLRAGVPLELLLRARTFQPRLGQSLRAEQWQPVAFRRARTQQPLLALTAHRDVRLQTGSLAPEDAVAVASLTAEQTAFLADPAPTLLLRGDGDWSVAAVAREPEFRAAVRVDVRLEAATFAEEIALHVDPQQAQLAQFEVLLPPGVGQAWQWLDSAAPNAPASSEFVSAGPEGDRWRLRLDRPRSQEFTLVARRFGEWSDKLSATLPRVVHAQSQRLEVVLHASPAARIAPVTVGLQEQPRTTDAELARRYVATSDAGASFTAVRLPREAEVAQTILWQVANNLSARPGQPLLLEQVVQLENRSAEELFAKLPADWQPLAVWLDGRPAVWRQSGPRVMVELPGDRTALTLVLHAKSVDSLSNWHDALDLQLPRWQGTTIAETVRVAGSPAHTLLAADRRHGWSAAWQVLLGSAARAAERLRFPAWRAGQSPARVAEEATSAGEAVVAALSAVRGATWGEWLTRAEPHLQTAGVQLAIDGPALFSQGVSPTSPPAFVNDGRAPRDQTIAALQFAGLVLYARQNLVLLTSRWQVSSRVATAGDPEQLIWSPASPTESARLAQCAAWPGPRQWRLTSPPWAPPAVSTAPPGGQTLALSARHGRAAFVLVAHDGYRALAAALALACGLLPWLLPRTGRAWLIACCALAATVPWLSEVWGALALAAGVGLGGGWIALAAVRQCALAPVQPPNIARSSMRFVVRTASALLAALGLAVGAWALAQEPPAESQAVYNVFIPVDAQRQPTGGRYLIPEAFETALRARAAAQMQAKGWVLAGARYAGNVEPASGGFVVRELNLELELYVLQAGVTVRLPLGDPALHVLPDSALLDGAPLTLRRAADQAWEFRAPGLGLNRLQLQCQILEPALDGLSLAISPAPRSELDLTFPPEAAPWTDAGAAQVAHVAGAPVVRYRASLSARWEIRRSAAESAPGTAPLELQESAWLRVQPGSVTLEVRWQGRAPDGPREDLQLLLDERLRLLPLPAGSPLAAVVGESPVGGERGRRMRLQWKSPPPRQIDVRLTFLLGEASGTGRLAWPLCQLQNAPATQVWRAVSVASSLEHRFHVAPEVVGEPVESWRDLWSQAADVPTAVFRGPWNSAQWQLETAPRTAEVRAQELLLLGCRRRDLRFEWTAECDVRGGPCPVFRVQTPAGCQIEQVVLYVDEEESPIRWAQADPQTCSIQVDAPRVGRQTLLLRGRLPVPADGRLPLPRLKLLAAAETSRRIAVYRLPEVRVALSGGQAVVGDPTDRPDVNAAWGALAFVLRDSAGAAESDDEATLVVLPNRPRIEMEQALTFLPTDDVAEVELAFRAQVADGTLDELRWSVPREVSQPILTQGAGVVRLEPAPGNADVQQLIYLPAQFTEGELTAAIRVRIAADRQEGFLAPRATPLGAASAAELLLLPTQWGRQQIGWQTSDLESTELPTARAASANAPSGMLAFRVVGPTPKASLIFPRPRPRPTIALAEYLLLASRDGVQRAIAQLDLAPTGRTTCTLRVPAGWQVQHLFLEGESAPLAAAADGAWQFSLHDPWSPQRLLAILERSADVVAGDAQTLRMELQGIAAQRELWHVLPLEPTLAEATDLAAENSPWLVRAEALSELLAVPEPPGPNQALVRARWSARAETAQGVLRVFADQAPENPSGATTGPASPAESVSDSTVDGNAGRPPWTALSDRAWQSLADFAWGSTSSAGAARDAALAAAKGRWSPRLWRLAGTSFWLALLALAAWAPQRWREHAERLAHPAAGGVLAGLCWWLWLVHGGWGLLLASACGGLWYWAVRLRRRALAPAPAVA